MSKIETNSDFQTAVGKARHVLSPERIIETREQAFFGLEKLLSECVYLFPDVAYIMGNFKDLKVAKNKAIRDYDGDESRITDHVRAKLRVELPETISALTSKDFKKLLNKHGIHVAEMNDYFSDPKDETGYRALNYKLAIPVGFDEQGKPEYHVVELQVVAEQIEAVYDQTHKYKRRAEQAEDEINHMMHQYGIFDMKDKYYNGAYLTPAEENTLAWFEEYIEPYREIRDKNYAACRLIHARAAKESYFGHNLQSLVAPDKREKHDLSPQMESEYERDKKWADENELYLS